MVRKHRKPHRPIRRLERLDTVRAATDTLRASGGHRWLPPILALLCVAAPPAAQAGEVLACRSRDTACLITVSGEPADRELAARLTAAALQGEAFGSVEVTGERAPQSPAKGCQALVSVHVERSASSVAVTLTSQFPAGFLPSDSTMAVATKREGRGTGPELVTSLEEALFSAGFRARGAPLIALLPPPLCTPSQAPAVRALLVGINRYSSEAVPSLRGAVRDTSLIEGALLARHPTALVTKLLDRAATRAALHRALSALVEASQCGDIVFIHYSGHSARGPADRKAGLPRWDQGRMALFLSDGEYLGESALRGFVTALRNRRAQVVVLLDTNAGDANLGASWRRAEGDGAELLRGAGELAVLTAGETAREYPFPEGPAGLFSLAVALALQQEGALGARSLASAIGDKMRLLGESRPAGVPFFEAGNPDVSLLPGAHRPAAALEVRFDGDQEGRGGLVLKGAATVTRTFVIAGTAAGAGPLSALLANGKVAELGPSGRFRVELELRPGPQKVDFVGVGSDLSLATASREVQVGTEVGAPQGQRYALLIGIQQYEKWSALQTPIADVREVGRLLRERYGFATSLASFGDLVLENPDKVRIGSAFVALRRALGPDDSLLVYFAGHGKAEGPKERRHAYWIPREGDPENRATWYSGQDLLSEIAMPDMRARHVLVFSDSCFSGDLTRDKPNPPSDLTDAERERRLATAAAQVSRILVTSGYDEPVLDGGGEGHSVFARALIDGLSRIPEERFLSFDLFSRFIDQQVGGKSPQRPHHWYLKDSGHDGGDMPFVRNNAGK